MERFSRPVHHQRGNLHGRAHAQALRVYNIQARRTVRNRVRIHPYRIDRSHELAKRNQRIHELAFFERPEAAVMFHAERLLEIHVPVVGMLVVRSLVPSASVRRNRAHLHRIIRDNHRGRHVVPRAHQANRLRFRRIELEILHVHLGTRVEPYLVNARREKVHREHTLVLREVRVLRPLVAAAQNLEPRPGGTPLRRRH